MNIENFERAFGSNIGGCRRECACGREFYDAENICDWDEGELEGLKVDEKATPLPYAVGSIVFEGREYVADCNCWHDRAVRFMEFIDTYARQIASYLTLERDRKQREADAAPVVR